MECETNHQAIAYLNAKGYKPGQPLMILAPRGSAKKLVEAFSHPPLEPTQATVTKETEGGVAPVHPDKVLLEPRPTADRRLPRVERQAIIA